MVKQQSTQSPLPSFKSASHACVGFSTHGLFLIYKDVILQCQNLDLKNQHFQIPILAWKSVPITRTHSNENCMNS